MTIEDLKRIDDRPIPTIATRSARSWLSGTNRSGWNSTLKHYRQLGVNRFFIVDGGSTDGTLDYLAAAPDVHAFSASGGDSMALVNSLLDTFGAGHWTLTVEADEMFIYPHYEQLELPLFCKYLDYVGSQAVPCVSIDMYAASPIWDAVHRPGAPLLDTCPYFDAAPYRWFRRRICPYFKIYGGVRQRAFGQNPNRLRYSAEYLWSGGRPACDTWRHSKHHARNSGQHLGRDFAFRISQRLCRTLARIELSEGLSTNLYSDSSVRFKNSAQLVELELMKTERCI